jgi:hypothetical protein
VPDLYSVINDVDLINFNGSLARTALRINTSTKFRSVALLQRRYLHHLHLIKSFNRGDSNIALLLRFLANHFIALKISLFSKLIKMVVIQIKKQATLHIEVKNMKC